MTGIQPLDPDTGKTSGIACPNPLLSHGVSSCREGHTESGSGKFQGEKEGGRAKGAQGRFSPQTMNSSNSGNPISLCPPWGECGLLALLLFSAQPTVVRKRQCPRTMVSREDVPDHEHRLKASRQRNLHPTSTGNYLSDERFWVFGQESTQVTPSASW